MNIGHRADFFRESGRAGQVEVQVNTTDDNSRQQQGAGVALLADNALYPLCFRTTRAQGVTQCTYPSRATPCVRTTPSPPDCTAGADALFRRSTRLPSTAAGAAAAQGRHWHSLQGRVDADTDARAIHKCRVNAACG